jgi:hypothetical protein
LIALLTLEKIIQHVVVTLCFLFDFGGIRATVAVDYRYLMVAGGIVAILFFIALWALLTEKTWSISLVAGLAVFDIVGEFIAQGTIFITLISFVVAIALLILCYETCSRKD